MSSLITSTPMPHNSVWKLLVEFSLPSQPGSDHLVQEQAAAAVQRMNLSPTTLERLKSAIAEATLNAIEHSRHYQADLSIFIRILVSEQVAPVDGFDQANYLTLNPQIHDPISKGSEQPAQRGWGFFLIHKLKEGAAYPEEAHYSLELFLYQEDDAS